MSDNIIMAKYQGLGNDYLILDAVRNRVQLQGKKAALLCQRGFGLGADGVLYGPCLLYTSPVCLRNVYCFLDRKVIEYRMLRVYFWEYALRTVIRIYYTAEAVEKIKRKQE